MTARSLRQRTSSNMERWSGRVAMVTGASAGIGAAITQQLLDHGLHVVAVARRVDKIQVAVDIARKEYKDSGRTHSTKVAPGTLYARKCDVTKEEDILAVFKWVKENLKGVDVMVNNAGIGGDLSLTEAKTEDWRSLLDLNVLGLSICTREAVQSMRSRAVDAGHVIHISSYASTIPPFGSGMAMYFASKHAVRALTEGLRKDLVASKDPIKVTSVCPGFVRTEFLDNRPNLKKEDWINNPYLTAQDVADAALYTLGTPPHVQVHDIVVKAVGEKF